MKFVSWVVMTSFDISKIISKWNHDGKKVSNWCERVGFNVFLIVPRTKKDENSERVKIVLAGNVRNGIILPLRLIARITQSANKKE